MTDVLIYGDTIRSPELRHEVPVAVPDPFLYVERNGDRARDRRRSFEVAAAARGSADRRRTRTRSSAATSSSRRGCRARRLDLDLALRAAQELGHPRAPSCRATFPARARRPPARERHRARPDRDFFVAAPPGQERGRARRHPPRPDGAPRRAWRAARELLPAGGAAATAPSCSTASRSPASASRHEIAAGLRRARAALRTTSSSRTGRRPPSATTWARARSRRTSRS